jgi:hypothetical protein
MECDVALRFEVDGSAAETTVSSLEEHLQEATRLCTVMAARLTYQLAARRRRVAVRKILNGADPLPALRNLRQWEGVTARARGVSSVLPGFREAIERAFAAAWAACPLPGEGHPETVRQLIATNQRRAAAVRLYGAPRDLTREFIGQNRRLRAHPRAHLPA